MLLNATSLTVCTYVGYYANLRLNIVLETCVHDHDGVAHSDWLCKFLSNTDGTLGTHKTKSPLNILSVIQEVL